MDNVFFFLIIIMAGLAGLLLFVAFVSWYRLRTIKLILVGCAFVGFFVKAILLLTSLVVQDEKTVLIDCIVLVLLYFAVIKK